MSTQQPFATCAVCFEACKLLKDLFAVLEMQNDWKRGIVKLVAKEVTLGEIKDCDFLIDCNHCNNAREILTGEGEKLLAILQQRLKKK